MKLIAEVGVDVLSIDRLCLRLDRTKGSFYHHFANFELYRDALLDEWERINTDEPIAQIQTLPADSRGKALGALVRRLDHPLDREIRRSASRDHRAREVVARVDRKRLAILETIWRERGATAERARLAAELEYAAFVGVQHLDLNMNSSDADRLERTLLEILADWANRKT